MATTLRSFGDLTVIDAVNAEMYEIRGNVLSMTSELDTEDILAFPSGGASELQTRETVVNSTTWTFSLTTGSIQKDTLQLVFRKKFVTSGLSALELPCKDIVNVPASPGPYVAPITGYSEDDVVYAKTLSTAKGGGGDVKLTQIANGSVGSIASGQIAISDTQATFHEDQAGQTVAISGFRSQTPNSMLSGTNTNDEIGTLSFYGIFKPVASAAVLNLYVPVLNFTEGTDFASDADDLTLGLTAGTKAGYNGPLVIWD